MKRRHKNHIWFCSLCEVINDVSNIILKREQRTFCTFSYNVHARLYVKQTNQTWKNIRHSYSCLTGMIYKHWTRVRASLPAPHQFGLETNHVNALTLTLKSEMSYTMETVVRKGHICARLKQVWRFTTYLTKWYSTSEEIIISIVSRLKSCSHILEGWGTKRRVNRNGLIVHSVLLSGSCFI